MTRRATSFRPVRAVFGFTAVLAIAGHGAAVTASAPPGTAEPDTQAASLTSAQREVLREATERFRDPDEAIAAGYVPTDECTPGMGYHYGHPGLVGDTNIDPTMPDILVYEPASDGPVQLVALEYFRADADSDKATEEDRPTLFGHPFDGPMEGHPVPDGAPPMPIHYDLHVWLYKTNPAGELAPKNPDINCP